MTDVPVQRSVLRIGLEKMPEILLLLLFLVLVAIMVPTGLVLASGPWQTEQEGHGPFIILVAIWLAWSKRDKLNVAPIASAPVTGWLCLLCGLPLLYIGRSLQILSIETFSVIPMLAGIVLLTCGPKVLRIVAFPLGILVFAVPPPNWLMDALTLPLKLAVSDAVTRLLYWAGLPIAQNGVVIMIGPYQLLVKDACAGMNSIFALSAIGLIYLYLMQSRSTARSLLLLLAILPITIFANFFRVALLVLVAYYFGSEYVEGPLHELSGLALFATAFLALVVLDTVLGLIFRSGPTRHDGLPPPHP